MMKSVVLTPYCPLPVDSGAKAEMCKHLDLLLSMGDCTIVSAATRPVGMGWNTENKEQLIRRGFGLRLREKMHPFRNWQQWAGLGYGVMCKGFKLERAFGHANPYHRHAFPTDFLFECSRTADLAVINYSYWGRLPTACPKVLVLHDLLSKWMWGNHRYEAEELQKADLLVVISKDEEIELRKRGFTNIIWSPPLAQPSEFPINEQVCIVGSANFANREGLRWLHQSPQPSSLSLAIYGSLSQFITWPETRKIVRYANNNQPYQECGIMLLPTALGMGVQIKAVEALAAGRAIVARKGAMRGLPSGEGAWLEVNSPAEMWAASERLSKNTQLRRQQAAQARAYYRQYLDANEIHAQLRQAYCKLLTGRS